MFVVCLGTFPKEKFNLAKKFFNSFIFLVNKFKEIVHLFKINSYFIKLLSTGFLNLTLRSNGLYPILLHISKI